MTTVLDVVVPVHDEEATLAASMRRLHDHLTGSFPYAWRLSPSGSRRSWPTCGPCGSRRWAAAGP